ncbi:hypothetical protein LZ30DRAFT_695792 [Colletotrichum cereale]|nr:hypothetical protein LZ30DRAFT_695792 [Colletotrichum cereale]
MSVWLSCSSGLGFLIWHFLSRIGCSCPVGIQAGRWTGSGMGREGMESAKEGGLGVVVVEMGTSALDTYLSISLHSIGGTFLLCLCLKVATAEPST